VRLPFSVRLGFISTKSETRPGSAWLIAVRVYCPSGIPANSILPESLANALCGTPLLGVKVTRAPEAGLPFGNETWTYIVESLMGAGKFGDDPGCAWQPTQAERRIASERVNLVEALRQAGSTLWNLVSKQPRLIRPPHIGLKYWSQ
jgi:hypothetical protein